MHKWLVVGITIFVVGLTSLILIRGGSISRVGNEPIEVNGREAQIIPDVPKDAIPPLDFPKYASVKESAIWLEEDDLVLGVIFGDDARAYPISILNWHEIVNETIDGVPLVVTYCPLCKSGVVFDRRLEGKELSFGNTGALFESALVMYDRETESYWYHVAGEAIKGELLGKKLTILPSIMLRWEEWKDRYPNSHVLSLNTGFNRDYLNDSYVEYNRVDSRPAFPISHLDERLLPKERVVGVSFDGVSRAYPLRLLRGLTINDTVGGNNLEVIVNSRGDSAEVFLISDSQRTLAPQTNAFWFAWAIANPDTEIYEN